MTETSYELEQRLFDEALDHPEGPERDAFIRSACEGDRELEMSLRQLLSSDGDASAFFESGAGTLTELVSSAPISATSATNPVIGTDIGPYRVLELIGEGGCGSVFLAEQQYPLRRRVALKIIKLGMDTDAVIGRFEAERQALAMMEHPNIAHVLDAGSTTGGLPYFVMEWVSGSCILEYCREHRLTTAARLGLFVKVCHAIQHAHQKGVIHRDIKPSNILITLKDGQPVPKVIDFGIAKATDIPLTDTALLTHNLQMIGTPAYMSPEQVERSDMKIDTRSDIYSLGALLYELLVGQPPFDPHQLTRSGLGEMLRILRETEPPLPSSVLSGLPQTALATRAAERKTDATGLLSEVRGDLDWIASKALEKHRSRRYESAHAFAEDIGRHLSYKPVVARPPTRRYVLEKWIRRNRTVFAAAVSIATILIAATIVSTRLHWNERKALSKLRLSEKMQTTLRHEADLRREQAERLQLLSEAREKITQAVVLLRDGDFPAADAIVDGVPLIQPSPEGADVFRRLADWHAFNGRWNETVERSTYLFQINQLDANNVPALDCYRVVAAALEMGDKEGYDRFRNAMISRFSTSTDVVSMERIVKIALLLPADANQMRQLDPLIERCIDSFQDPASMARDSAKNFLWRMVCVSLGEYRRGHFKQAEEWARKSLEVPTPNRERVATARILLACSLFHQNRPDEARTELSLANEVVATKFSEVPNFVKGDFWPDWIISRLLLGESGQLVR
ncbi:protein kinase [Luteolibacter yonseiensis]|uniref:Protein kinase n=1 Tax=Luteolibacter yonseiensis TaxID=1144680 RepID=A0A934R6T9_9BACT|nr:serine/threonine-protein kinase [Luteolibacter yonseiensis]MBK1817033.1 protein kinase [Luteolibacter yonseiensis]